MTAKATIVDKLKEFTPMQFENIVYDLITSAGLRNAVWRTPGSDGGRDIEGEMATTDFSGFSVSSKWYIECKRYAATIDWPTVWEKIAYADSQSADYLLVVTTASLSPQCKTEVSNWNARRRRPAVRFWEGHKLEEILIHYPNIIVRYSLAPDTKLVPASFVKLSRETSKIVQAAYGSSEMADVDNPALEAAAAMAELLTVRITNAEDEGQFKKSPFVPEVDGFQWLTFDGDCGVLHTFDRHGFRAVLAIVRHVTGCQTTTAAIRDGVVRITLPAGRLPNAAATTLLTEVSIWGNLEVRMDKQDFVVSRRL